ncbi:FmdB family zinc ribbon protein [Wenzhouxiangella sp. EGI_FJ10305]|uniref:FmdB family zinc ribbon protein n=1 Tax=Wenzhouxiangella sp. EGI_FJ10305 TaxID=3243768 RepID=UPI0035DDDA9E
MPIYEYRCKSCGHELEKLQKIADLPLVDCPECGRPELTKLISAAGFRLKGGGWYETDFKKDNKRNLAGDAKKESKPEGKSGAKDKKDDKKSTSSGSDKGGSAGSSSSGQAA